MDQMVLAKGTHFIEKPFTVYQFEKKLEALLISAEGGRGQDTP